MMRRMKIRAKPNVGIGGGTSRGSSAKPPASQGSKNITQPNNSETASQPTATESGELVGGSAESESKGLCAEGQQGTVSQSPDSTASPSSVRPALDTEPLQDTNCDNEQEETLPRSNNTESNATESNSTQKTSSVSSPAMELNASPAPLLQTPLLSQRSSDPAAASQIIPESTVLQVSSSSNESKESCASVSLPQTQLMPEKSSDNLATQINASIAQMPEVTEDKSSDAVHVSSLTEMPISDDRIQKTGGSDGKSSHSSFNNNDNTQETGDSNSKSSHSNNNNTQDTGSSNSLNSNDNTQEMGGSNSKSSHRSPNSSDNNQGMGDIDNKSSHTSLKSNNDNQGKEGSDNLKDNDNTQEIRGSSNEPSHSSSNSNNNTQGTEGSHSLNIYDTAHETGESISKPSPTSLSNSNDDADTNKMSGNSNPSQTARNGNTNNAQATGSKRRAKIRAMPTIVSKKKKEDKEDKIALAKPAKGVALKVQPSPLSKPTAHDAVLKGDHDTDSSVVPIELIAESSTGNVTEDPLAVETMECSEIKEIGSAGVESLQLCHPVNTEDLSKEENEQQTQKSRKEGIDSTHKEDAEIPLQCNTKPCKKKKLSENNETESSTEEVNSSSVEKQGIRKSQKEDFEEFVNSDDSLGDKENTSSAIAEVPNVEKPMREHQPLVPQKAKSNATAKEYSPKKTLFGRLGRKIKVEDSTEKAAKQVFKKRKDEFRKKMSKGDLAPGKMTMFDLIYWNPVSNPMPGRSASPKRSNGSVRSSGRSDTDSITSETAEEQRVDDLGLDPTDSDHQSHPDTPEVVDVRKVTENTSEDSKEGLGGTEEEEQEKEKEKEGEESEEKEGGKDKNDDNEDSSDVKDIFAPRVKIGPDGQIIVDEQSIKIQTTAAKNRDEILKNSVVVEESGESSHYGKWSKRRRKSFEWTVKETALFYKALSTVGTDFSLMETLMKWRTRAELKTKFKKEERNHRELVDLALNDSTQFDMTVFEEESGYDPTEDRKAARQAERAEAKRRRLEMKQQDKVKAMEKKKLKAKQKKVEISERKKMLKRAYRKKAKKRKVDFLESDNEDSPILYDSENSDLTQEQEEARQRITVEVKHRPRRRKRQTQRRNSLVISEVTVTMETVKYGRPPDPSPIQEVTVIEHHNPQSPPLHRPASLEAAAGAGLRGGGVVGVGGLVYSKDDHTIQGHTNETLHYGRGSDECNVNFNLQEHAEMELRDTFQEHTEEMRHTLQEQEHRAQDKLQVQECKSEVQHTHQPHIKREELVHTLQELSQDTQHTPPKQEHRVQDRLLVQESTSEGEYTLQQHTKQEQLIHAPQELTQHTQKVRHTQHTHTLEALNYYARGSHDSHINLTQQEHTHEAQLFISPSQSPSTTPNQESEVEYILPLGRGLEEEDVEGDIVCVIDGDGDCGSGVGSGEDEGQEETILPNVYLNLPLSEELPESHIIESMITDDSEDDDRDERKPDATQIIDVVDDNFSNNSRRYSTSSSSGGGDGGAESSEATCGIERENESNKVDLPPYPVGEEPISVSDTEKMWHFPISAIQTLENGQQVLPVPTPSGYYSVPVPVLPPGTSNVVVVATSLPDSPGEHIYHVYIMSPVESVDSGE